MVDGKILEPRVRESLETAGIPYEPLACDPAFADTAAFCETYGFAPEQAANTIIVASRKEPKQYAACLVLANGKLDVNRTVSAILGIKRLSFASGEDTAVLTGMMVGGVTLFGLPSDWPLLIDGNVMQQPLVILGGGNRSSKVKVDPKHLTRLPNARVVDGLAMPRGE